MSVSEVTDPSAVLQAMQEFDATGRDGFLRKYGFGQSRKFSIIHEGRQYDSKPILAAAYGYQFPEKGPLEWRAFNGGAPTVNRLERLGFQCEPATAGPAVVFTTADIDLFARYRPKVKWGPDTVPAEDQAEFRNVRNRLKSLAQWVSDEVASDALLTPFTSTLQPNGYTPLDMWCCLFSQEAPNKSYALQVALIVSSTGAEACICLGAGRSQLSHDKAVEAEAYFTGAQGALASVPPSVAAQVEGLLPQGVKYLRAWRDPAAESAFLNLDEWLRHASSPEGAQASISLHFTADELDAAGTEIADVLLQLAVAAIPLFQHIHTHGHAGGASSTTIDESADQRSRDGSSQTERVRAMRSFNWQELRRIAQESPQALELDDEVYRAVAAAIQAGKHVIFTGPPGTAKTTLAELTCALAAEAGLCDGYLLTTATADWTTYETIGGLHPSADGSGLEFEFGHFLEASESRQWLVIDELNRSNFDRAFGQLFTVLSGQSVVLPYKDARSGKRIALVVEGLEAQYPAGQYRVSIIPHAWRIVATMNVFDKSLLFEMSYALMRRFAFIEVPSPDPAVFQELWKTHLQALDQIARDRVSIVLAGLLELRGIKDIGPAVFIDMAKFASAYVREGGLWSSQQLSYQLFFSYLLPQFEGIDDAKGRALFTRVRPLVGSKLKERLRVVLVDVLGIALPATSATVPDSTDDANGLDAEGDASEPAEGAWR